MQLCSDSPKYKEPTNLPELNQYNDIQFVQINPLVSDEKNNSLACSQLNSRDLLHQIKLACSIDLEFQNKKLSLDSYRGFDKEGLFIELERQLHISVDDSKENDNTRTITEKHDEVSKQFSLSPSVSNGHKKDVELQPEFMEMNMSKSKLQCDKDYSIPQTANGSARFVNRTPTVVHSLYEKNSSSVEISVHQVSTFILLLNTSRLFLLVRIRKVLFLGLFGYRLVLISKETVMNVYWSRFSHSERKSAR